MIEFVLKNRKFRLHPDGIIYVRAHRNGVETKNGTWKQVKFCETSSSAYLQCKLRFDGVPCMVVKHRLVYYAHNQSWNIFDSSMNNMIDHINGNRSDNHIENLRKVTHQQNMWNSKAKGYTWSKGKSKWQSQIMINHKKKHLGYFDNEEDARNAYLEAKNTYHIIE
jgi:hypothetical protein